MNRAPRAPKSDVSVHDKRKGSWYEVLQQLRASTVLRYLIEFTLKLQKFPSPFHERCLFCFHLLVLLKAREFTGGPYSLEPMNCQFVSYVQFASYLLVRFNLVSDTYRLESPFDIHSAEWTSGLVRSEWGWNTFKKTFNPTDRASESQLRN